MYGAWWHGGPNVYTGTDTHFKRAEIHLKQLVLICRVVAAVAMGGSGADASDLMPDGTCSFFAPLFQGV